MAPTHVPRSVVMMNEKTVSSHVSGRWHGNGVDTAIKYELLTPDRLGSSPHRAEVYYQPRYSEISW